MTEKEIDCNGTDEVVCPFCGYEFSDSWDFDFQGNEIEIECGNEACEKTFLCSPSYTVTYYSDKPKVKAPNDRP